MWTLSESCINWISLMLCVISISVDPVFLYIPLMKLENSCIAYDMVLAIISCVLRSVIDALFVIFTRYPLGTNASTPQLPRMTYLEVLAILPLPQVVIALVYSIMILSVEMNVEIVMNLLKVCICFQFFPRVIRIYPLFRKVSSTRIPVEVTWAKAAVNLCLYIIAGHAFGALWYLFAIEREVDCWKKACIGLTHTRCHHLSFSCHASSGNHMFLNHVCSTESLIKYDFGIYVNPIHYAIVEARYVQKFVYCFRWGLQSLTCLGQNLVPSSVIQENVFTIMITISSLLLFIFLLGNMQLYIQGDTSKNEEKKRELREIVHCNIFKNLPSNLQEQIENHYENLWQQTRGVDIEVTLNKLPKNLRKKVKCMLGLPVLKKVANFGSLPKPQLEALSQRLQVVQYAEGSSILEKGDKIEELLIIADDGKLCVTMQNGENTSGLSLIEYCGEELFDWAAQSLVGLPISNRTLSAFTKIDAFSLAANDIIDVFNEFRPRLIRSRSL